MASFFDSVRTVMGCKRVAFKFIFISAILSYPLYQVLSGPFKGWGDMWTILTVIATIFYLGYIMIASSNLINEEAELFIGFLNPFKILAAGLGGIIAVLPVSVGMYYAGISLYSAMVERALPVTAISVTVFFVEVLLLGVLAVQMMLFAYKYNPLSAYNVLHIVKNFPDFALKSVPAIFGDVLLGAVAAGSILIPVYKIFGSGYIFFMLIVLLITFLFAFLTNFYAQLALENIVLTRKVEYDEGAGDVLDQSLLTKKDNKKKKNVKKK